MNRKRECVDKLNQMIELISRRCIMYMKWWRVFLFIFYAVFNCDWVFFCCLHFILRCINISIQSSVGLLAFSYHYWHSLWRVLYRVTHSSAAPALHRDMNLTIYARRVFFFVSFVLLLLPNRTYWPPMMDSNTCINSQVKYVINVRFDRCFHFPPFIRIFIRGAQFVHSDNTFNCHRKLKIKTFS